MTVVGYCIPCPRCGHENAHVSQNIDVVNRGIEISCFICGYYCVDGEDVNTSGVYAIFFKKGGAKIESIQESIDHDLIKRFIAIIRGPDVDESKCYLTRWDERKKTVAFIVGDSKKVPWPTQKSAIP